MQNGKATKPNSKAFSPAIIIAGLLWILALAPLILADLNIWSLNHLIFLPPWCLALYIVSGLIALAFLIPPLRKPISDRFDKTAGILMDKPSRLIWWAVAPMSLPVFWFLRMPTHFLGDGYEVIGNLSGESPVIYKWAEIGAIWIVHQVAEALPLVGKTGSEYAYAIISVISGAATILIFIALVHELGRRASEKLFILLLLIFSGWSLLFFGYTENYPILWPFMTAYIYFSIRYINGKNSLLPPSMFLVAAIALHLQSLFFLVSFPFLLMIRGRGLRFYRRYRPLVFSLGFLVIVAGGIIFFLLYRQSLAFQLYFVPLLEGRPAIPGYTLISPAHLIDILNELTLLVPLWPVLLLLSWSWWRRGAKDGISWFLMWFSIGGLAFIFMVDPKLGMARDWDLFALSGSGPLLLLARGAATGGDSKSSGGFFAGLALLSMVLVFPFMAANLSENPSLQYFSWILRHDTCRSQPGMVQLRNYYGKYGDSARADSLNREIHRLFPRIDQIQRAHELIRSGRVNECLAVANQLLKDNPFLGEGYYLRGLVYLNTGQYQRAIDDFELVREMSPYDHLVYVNLSIAYQEIGRPDLMMKNLRTAQNLKPDDLYVLQALTMLFLNQDKFDSSLVYSRQLLAVDSVNLTGLLAGGVAHINLGRVAEGRRQLTRYLAVAPPGPDRNRVEEIMRRTE